MGPIMQQYHAAKARHPGMVLLFRVGDFFEAFGEDAETVARECGLTLTHRADLAMCGFPHHGLESYLHRLLRAGHRVAICEPVESVPKSAKVEKSVIGEGLIGDHQLQACFNWKGV